MNQSKAVPQRKLFETTPSRQPKRYLNQTSKSINQQLYQLMTNVGILQNHLLDEQKRKQMLLEENGINRQTLEQYKNNKQLREVRIRQLRDQAQAHKITSKTIQECDDSMKLLHKQIQNLKRDVQKKDQQCISLQKEIPELQKNIDNYSLSRQNSLDQRKAIQESIDRYLQPYPSQYDKNVSHLDNLDARLTNLLIGMQSIQMQEDKTRRQYQKAINGQKQCILKIQYQKQLLQQRVKDNQKNQQIARICQHQGDLDKTVQEMLVKEDQLVDQLTVLNGWYNQEDKKLRNLLQHKEDAWAFQRQGYQRQLRQLKMSHGKLSLDLQQYSQLISQKKQKRQRLSSEYQLIHRLHLNLSSMQRLRQVQQRNNYLKIKIAEVKDIKALMIQQRQIVPTARFYS